MRRRGYLPLLLAVCCAGCGGAAFADAGCVPSGQWYAPATKKTLAASEVLSQLARRRVVLLGEHHDNADHHRWQLHVVAALAALRPDLVLGFEMLPRRVQPVLDRWVRGELSEEEFAKQLDWDANWSFDFGYYQPLFHLARMQRVPLRALNVDRALFNRVTANGWDAVPLAEREGVGTPAPASRDYLRFLAGSFLRHNPPDAPTAATETQLRFLRFVQGQQLWDRAMAEAIAAAARGAGAPLVIAVMGSWHIANRFGVPEQLRDLKLEDVAVVVPWDEHFECAQLTPEFADVIFGIQTP
jgi:uncharacterized iron-regulated protein